MPSLSAYSLDGAHRMRSDADAVAAHDDGRLDAVLVEHVQAHRVGVLVPSLKMWPISTIFFDLERQAGDRFSVTEGTWRRS